MARIVIVKSYPLDDGSISGMFRVPKEAASKVLRHELVDLEGVEAEIALPEIVADPAAPVDHMARLRELQRDAEAETVHVMAELMGYRTAQKDEVTRPCGATPSSGGLFSNIPPIVEVRWNPMLETYEAVHEGGNIVTPLRDEAEATRVAIEHGLTFPRINL